MSYDCFNFLLQSSFLPKSSTQSGEETIDKLFISIPDEFTLWGSISVVLMIAWQKDSDELPYLAMTNTLRIA